MSAFIEGEARQLSKYSNFSCQFFHCSPGTRRCLGTTDHLKPENTMTRPFRNLIDRCMTAARRITMAVVIAITLAAPVAAQAQDAGPEAEGE